ncbi:MAG: hypothetical protein ACI4JC_00725 [Faecalibacterium sp.]
MQDTVKTTAQILVDCLEAEGVDVMFAIRDSHIRFIPVRYERGGAFMADIFDFSKFCKSAQNRDNIFVKS